MLYFFMDGSHLRPHHTSIKLVISICFRTHRYGPPHPGHSHPGHFLGRPVHQNMAVLIFVS